MSRSGVGIGVSKSRAIEMFLSTGEIDPSWAAWDGDGVAGSATLRKILGRILVHRSNGAPLGRREAPDDAHRVLVDRVGLMVCGLFSPDVAHRILSALPECLQIIAVPDFTEHVSEVSIEDAWCLANIVLEDMGAPPLSDGAPQLDGLCLGQKMWVPPGAFGAPSATADVLVHEVAHLLHTAPGTALALTESTSPLLVPASHHETFAYACELWACRERQAAPPDSWLPDALNAIFMADPRVDIPLLGALLRQGEDAGWSAIRSWVDGLGEASRSLG